MSSDLADFLLARIAEDETDARACGTLDWFEGERGFVDCLGGPVVRALSSIHETAEHIAAWDPARVLAECEAKRRIVELSAEIESTDDALWHDRGLPSDPGYNAPRLGEQLLRLLALPYADHPDYREEWRP